jgi:carboxymethylenebutenolidase
MNFNPDAKRLKASDFPQELLNIFDLYVHGDIDRRAFLERAQKFAGAGVTATMLWEALRPNYAFAEVISKTDPRIKADYQTVPSPQGNGTIKGYFVRPANNTGKLPSVIVVHENRGLNPHIEDIARRLATAGFMAFAPDGLTSVGGYPGNEEEAAKIFGNVNRDKMVEDFVASAKWLKGRADSNGKLGAVGFCFGGGIVNTLAVRLGADLNAGVPFYGGQPSAADAAKIKAPLVLQYAGLDDRINAGWPAYETALKAAGVTYAAHIYPNVNHGFNNDTTPRFDKPAADLAWSRTLEHFNKYLK